MEKSEQTRSESGVENLFAPLRSAPERKTFAPLHSSLRSGANCKILMLSTQYYFIHHVSFIYLISVPFLVGIRNPQVHKSGLQRTLTWVRVDKESNKALGFGMQFQGNYISPSFFSNIFIYVTYVTFNGCSICHFRIQ